METAYRFDNHGHYVGVEYIMLDPVSNKPLLPSDCVLFAPDKVRLNNSWAVLNDKHTAWTYQAKPTSAKECLGISVKHSDQCPWAYEMRALFEKLCAEDAEHYRVARDEDLTQTVEAIPEKTFEEIKENKHSELKGVMSAKRQALTVTYDADTFDANEDAQANMIVLLKSFDLGASSVSIRSTNEQTHTFNKEHTQELSMLMLQAVNNLYSKYWEYKDALYSCKTIEEVEAISWKE